MAGLLATVALSLTAGSGVAWWLAILAGASEQAAILKGAEAVAERQRAEDLLLRAEWASYAGEAALAEHAWRDGDVRTAADRLRSMRRDFRDWEFSYLSRAISGNRRVLPGDGTVYATVRQDGRAIATSGKHNSTVIWDPRTGTQSQRLTGHTGPVVAPVFVPGRDDRVVTGSEDGTARLWDIAAGREVRVMSGHSGGITGVAVAHDGRRAATAGRDGAIRIWDLETGEQTLEIAGIGADILKLDFSPDGQRIAGGGMDGVCRVFDTADGRAVMTYAGHGSPVVSIAFHPQGHRIASGGIDGSLKLWEAETGREVLSLGHPPTAIWGVAFRHRGKQIASGSADGVLRIWDGETGELRSGWTGHTSAISSVSCADDGSVVTGGADGIASCWESDRQPGPVQLAGHATGIMKLAMDSGGRVLASAGMDGTVRVWDTREMREVRSLSTARPHVFSVAVSPDGKLVATGAEDVVELWNVPSGERLPLSSVQGSPSGDTASYCLALAVSQDMTTLACGRNDGRVDLLDLPKGTKRCTLRGHSSSVTAITFLPGGRVASASHDKTVRIWDGRTGKQLGVLDGQGEEVVCLTASPDGAFLASGGGHPPNPQIPGSVRIWDVKEQKLVRTILGHNGTVTGVAYSLSGLRLLTTSTDRRFRVWNTETGGEVLTLRREHSLSGLAAGAAGDVVAYVANPDPSPASPGIIDVLTADLPTEIEAAFSFGGHPTGVYGLTVGAAGSVLASGTADGQVKTWDMITGGELASWKSRAAGVYRLAAAPGGRIVGGAADGTVSVWDETTGNELLSFRAQTAHISGLAVSPDGRAVATVASDGGCALHKLTDARPRWLNQGAGSPATCVTFDGNGNFLLTGDGSGTIRRLDATSGREVNHVAVDGRWVNELSVSPNGQLLAVACEDQNGSGTVDLYRLPGLEPRRSTGSLPAIKAVIFSQDGRWIAGGAADGAVRVWNAQTGKLQRLYTGPKAAVHRVARNPRGRWLFGATDGGQNHLARAGELWGWPWPAD